MSVGGKIENMAIIISTGKSGKLIDAGQERDKSGGSQPEEGTRLL